ncbi:MAG TPA: phosphatidate cytidylyltransferase [Longimicrobiales bacterium]
MARSELAQRVAVAGVGIPLAVFLIYLGGWPLAAVLAVIAGGAAAEVYRLAARRGVRAFAPPGIAAAALFVLVAAARPEASAAALLWPLMLAFVLGVGAAAVWARGVEGAPLAVVSVTALGAILPGGTLAYALFLRHLPLGAGDARIGTALVVFAVGLTWINDACAYFAGRRWGRHRLIPRVSPGKTVEGAVAGVVGAVVVGGVFAALALEGWLELPIGPVAGAIGGALIGVIAQIGDLVESLYKREAGVKDSGRVLPGHGGFLDRFDALFYTLPVAYWYIGGVVALSMGGSAWR